MGSRTEMRTSAGRLTIYHEKEARATIGTRRTARTTRLRDFRMAAPLILLPEPRREGEEDEGIPVDEVVLEVPVREEHDDPWEPVECAARVRVVDEFEGEEGDNDADHDRGIERLRGEQPRALGQDGQARTEGDVVSEEGIEDARRPGTGIPADERTVDQEERSSRERRKVPQP